MSQKLYANNAGPIRVSELDARKVGRGYAVGHSFGTVKDLDTKKMYIVEQASCGADNCNCAVTIKLWATPKKDK